MLFAMSNGFVTRLFLVFFSLLTAAMPLRAQQFQSEIQAYLQDARTNWQLSDADIADWSVSDQYTDARAGITYTYLQQQIDGVRIFNAISTVALQQGRIGYFANRFYPNALAQANSATPDLSPERAIELVATHLGMSLPALPVLKQQEKSRYRWIFDHGSISSEPILVELCYMPVEEGFRLAWNVSIAPLSSSDWWNIRIDAHSGEFLDKNNWTVYCTFGENDTPAAVMPAREHTHKHIEAGGSATYNVFALPIEAPNVGVRSLLTDPFSLDASPFGWHDTNGAAGAEYTITRGNNVYAYEDKNDVNSPGYSPDGGPGLLFDFPLDESLPPAANQDANITNLFYANNAIHDILFLHGFNETAGNFQTKNYGNTGAGSDHVLAEAQDGGGTNNANFSTPPDGTSGRMQMYLWSGGNGIDGSLDNGVVIHEYGHGLSNRLTGGPSSTGCLNNNEEGGEGWSDWLALILTIEPGDAGTDLRTIGTYASNEPANGGGIRRFPYSTDMSINPQTYASLAGSGEVHDIGEIWCQVLWDMTWNLIDAEGFDPDWYYGTGGNHTALTLVIEAMKLQPCGPGYLDGRDAILAADKLLYNNAHRCLIWEAFARRGMGADALQGSANSTGDETPGYSLPNVCQTAVEPPIAQAAVDITISCYGVFRFTDQSTRIPQNWLWDFGDGATSDEEHPVHAYTKAGTFTVLLTVSNPLGSDTTTLTVTYNPPAAPIAAGDTTLCAGNRANLTVTPDPGNAAVWSVDGDNTILHTGTSFTTPPLTATTTFAVRQVIDNPKLYGGPPDNSFGTGGNHGTGFDGRLLFDAFEPFRLLSVRVYAQGQGSRTITLYNADNQVVRSVTVPVPNGESRVVLNFDIPQAGQYSIGNMGQNLYRNNSGASYPYVIGNLARINKSNATNNALAFYYYFYDWEIQAASCPSLPATVTVNVTPGPIANFSASANGLEVTFSDLTAGVPTSWSWDFGDNSPISTVKNPVHTFPTQGPYTVELTTSNGDCTSVFQKSVAVKGQSTATYNPATDAYGMSLFPNPATDQVHIAFQRIPEGPLSLFVTGVDGRILLVSQQEHATDQLLLDIHTLPAGVYGVRVSGREGSALRKLIVVR